MTDELDAVDAVFRGDRRFVLRYELRHCDRAQLEELLLMLATTHDLFDEITALLNNLPRTQPTEPPAQEALDAADTLVAHDERRLKESRP